MSETGYRDWLREWDDFRSGSLDSFQHIYNVYFNKLYAYGSKITTNAELLEDCIQELFLKLYTNRKNLSPTANLEYYLLKALKFTIYNKLNEERKFIDLESIKEEIFNVEFLVDKDDNDSIGAKKIEIIKQTLDSLSQSTKEILYLKFYSNLNYSEIGELMGIQPDSVKKHVYRTVSKLRELLGEKMLELFFICFEA
jgi:RNA polymerase sigma factor (sigma-70 family)